jgi:F-type H+-transporting ATPase subunit c
MKMLKLTGLTVVVFLVVAWPAFALDKETNFPPPPSPTVSGSGMAAGLGMGLTIIGAGIGFGRIGGAALDGMARQPEVAPRIQTAMLIIAAMLEGATLASVVFLFVIGLARATF